MRSCYSSTWNLPEVGLVDGFYFFAEEGTPFYPDWNYFGSANWHRGDGTPWPEFGEIEFATRKWVNGYHPLPQPPLKVIGSSACIAGDAGAYDGTPPATELFAGIDARCYAPVRAAYIIASGGCKVDGGWHSFAAQGGVKVDGQAHLVVHHVPPPIGGVRIGGGAVLSTQHKLTGSGGIKLDGAGTLLVKHSFLASGGIKLDGVGAATQRKGMVATGGVKLDGGAAMVARVRFVASGGIKLDGTATATQRKAMVGSGGMKFDGGGGMHAVPV